jgi:hypothetical protein
MDQIILRDANTPTGNLPFANPLIVMPGFCNAGYTYTNKPLRIIAIGRTLEELIVDIKDEVSWAYYFYTLVPDNILTAKAIELKNNLLALVHGDFERCHNCDCDLSIRRPVPEGTCVFCEDCVAILNEES